MALNFSSEGDHIHRQDIERTHYVRRKPRDAVANEWRNVWTVTRLLNRAFTAARFSAFDNVVWLIQLFGQSSTMGVPREHG